MDIREHRIAEKLYLQQDRVEFTNVVWEIISCLFLSCLILRIYSTRVRLYGIWPQ